MCRLCCLCGLLCELCFCLMHWNCGRSSHVCLETITACRYQTVRVIRQAKTCSRCYENSVPNICKYSVARGFYPCKPWSASLFQKWLAVTGDADTASSFNYLHYIYVFASDIKEAPIPEYNMLLFTSLVLFKVFISQNTLSDAFLWHWTHWWGNNSKDGFNCVLFTWCQF